MEEDTQAQNDESQLSRGERMQPNPSVLAKRTNDGFVLVHVDTNRIYELNHTASVYWELLERGLSSTEIEEEMSREFDVEKDELFSEIETLLRRLDAEDLVRRM